MRPLCTRIGSITSSARPSECEFERSEDVRFSRAVRPTNDSNGPHRKQHTVKGPKQPYLHVSYLHDQCSASVSGHCGRGDSWRAKASSGEELHGIFEAPRKALGAPAAAQLGCGAWLPSASAIAACSPSCQLPSRGPATLAPTAWRSRPTFPISSCWPRGARSAHADHPGACRGPRIRHRADLSHQAWRSAAVLQHLAGCPLQDVRFRPEAVVVWLSPQSRGSLMRSGHRPAADQEPPHRR